MPQLEFSTWIGQIFWLIVSFTAMYVLMSTLVIPRMQSITQRREQKNSGDLKRAEELRNEAQYILEEYTKILETARNEASKIISSVSDKINAEQTERIDSFNEKTKKATEIALQKISAAKSDALVSVDYMVSDVAVDALEKVVGISVDKKAINSALKLIK